MSQPFSKFSRSVSRRGSLYIAVLGVSLIVSTLAVGGIIAGRVQRRSSVANGDLGEARLCAQSGLELAKLWISQDVNWRTTRAAGDWTTGLALGGGSVTINVIDPTDGSLANRPHDPILITVTGQKGAALQTLRTTLAASPIPLSSLGSALHVPGQLHVKAGGILRMGDATASTSGSLRNDKTIEGAVEAGSVGAAGVVYGGIATGNPARAIPPASVADLYAALGTEISVGGSIDKQVLGPGFNPYGIPNADGVYVVRASSDVVVKNSRIVGTLVIICPGYNVKFDDKVVIETARSDYPALIIVGNLVSDHSGTLSESSNNVNFNPAGAPSNTGVTDTDKNDSYPAEIRGLVYVSGKIELKKELMLRGALISGSTATTDAIVIDGDVSVRYTQSLYTNPPQGFTSSVPMIPVGGSVVQVVN